MSKCLFAAAQAATLRLRSALPARALFAGMLGLLLVYSMTAFLSAPGCARTECSSMIWAPPLVQPFRRRHPAESFGGIRLTWRQNLLVRLAPSSRSLPHVVSRFRHLVACAACVELQTCPIRPLLRLLELVLPIATGSMPRSSLGEEQQVGWSQRGLRYRPIDQGGMWSEACRTSRGSTVPRAGMTRALTAGEAMSKLPGAAVAPRQKVRRYR